MQKQVFLEQFKRRGEERSCPARKLRKQAEELDLHHDFLQHTFRKEGFSEFDAQAKASKQLGNPIALADEAADAARQASWWGRHPMIGYILLPVVMLGPALVATVLLSALAIRLRFTNEQLQALFSNQNTSALAEAKSLLRALVVIHYAVLMLLTLPFTWMARRSAVGLGWATVPCLICACQGMFLHASVGRGGLRLYYDDGPNWLAALGPVLVAVAGFVRQWQRLRSLEPLPEDAERKATGLAAWNEMLSTPVGSLRARAGAAPGKREWFIKALKTPTYWVVAIIFVIIIPLLVLGRMLR
jgi:hypothetical protein